MTPTEAEFKVCDVVMSKQGMHITAARASTCVPNHAIHSWVGLNCMHEAPQQLQASGLKSGIALERKKQEKPIYLKPLQDRLRFVLCLAFNHIPCVIVDSLAGSLCLTLQLL